MTTFDNSPGNNLDLDYALSADGVASVRVSNGANTFESRVSDLHDSLLDLARMALSIQAGDRAARAVFVVDPGELHLVVDIGRDAASYEFRRFDDWASLQPAPDRPGELLLAGVTTAEVVIEQVTGILNRIRENPGPQQYKELSGGHEFPAEELDKLEQRDQLASGRGVNVPVLLARAFMVLAIAPPVYVTVYWLCSTVFSIYNLIWVPHIISLLVAVEIGWVVWSRSVILQTLAGQDRAVMLGAVGAGGPGFAAGFFGPLIYLPGSLQSPIFGALGAGTMGLIIGGISGLVFWRIRVRY